MFNAVSRPEAPGNEQKEWPVNLAPVMSALEEALKCSICHEFFNTPKLLPCGHSYCSDCIRQQGDLQSRSLGSRKCPECRAPWQESHLEVKAVHSLAVAVKAFQSAKPQIMDTVQQQTIENPASTSSDGHLQPHSRKRSRQNSAECNELAEQIQPTGDGKLSGASTAGEVPPKSAAEKAVPPGCGCCPMCNRVFSMRFLASHVNSCLISTEAADPSAKAGDVQKKGGDSVVDLTDPADEEVQDAVVPQLPPKICFNLLKEKDARKKLQDLGLSAVGEKNELEKRYQSFRQYVQIAHDKGQHAPLCKLARSYTNEQQRRAQAVSAPQKSLEGADSDFSTLITVAKRRIEEHKVKMASVAQENVPEENAHSSDHSTGAGFAE